MKKPNFFSWYYNEGLPELLEIWKNFLNFSLHYFSISEMLITLFSPWRKDVVSGNWSGFHPLRRIELVASNAFSRLIGAVIRLIMITFGLSVYLLVLFFGLIFAIFWISAPLALGILLLYASNGILNVYIVIGIIGGYLVLVLASYFSDKDSFDRQNYVEFFKSVLFERVCGRMGIVRKKFPMEILAAEDLLADFLKKRNLSLAEYENIIQLEFEFLRNSKNKHKFWRAENLLSITPIGRHWRYGYTFNLDKYCTDLSEHDFSAYGDSQLIGRENEYAILKLVLERPDQNCALIVGNPGIGKKTLIHELARNVRSSVENDFDAIRVLSLDLGRVISDAINKGDDVENFLRKLFYEASYAGNIILVIENLDNFLGKSESAFHPDISPVLLEFLEVPSFKIIASSTSKAYHNLIEKQQQIAKYFEVIEVREPSNAEALSIMLERLKKYEFKRVLFTFGALKTIIKDSERYNWEFPLPERALDLMMDAFGFWEKNSDEQFVTEKTIADYLSLKTGVAHGEIDGGERKRLLELEKSLHKSIIGQEEAVNQVAQALRRSRSGIGDSKKPIGSFLFLGPTGVGKTEMAKALAKTYFGDEAKMIRLDMSEFQTPNSIDRLLGSPQLNQPGRLVTQIKDNPYSLLLLDEIEKAYPELLDIFLQILDEGYVTDAFGEKINFRNIIIIATSNAGAALIKDQVAQGLAAEQIKQSVIDWVIENNVFRTEFLNRFEGVIFFRPLNGPELISVVRLQLQKLARRIVEEKNIEISFDDVLINQIIQKGYDPIFGARSLNRYIENEVETIVARKIISGEVTAGGMVELN